MADPYYIDIHCHPSLKPYAHSSWWHKNTTDPDKRWSIWHQIRPNDFKELFNKLIKSTHFTQSDFRTLSDGNIRVIYASLSPLEKGFFVSKLGTGPFTDMVANFVTGIGIKKINFIQKNKDYFSELEKEMKFYERLHNKEVEIDTVKKKYRIVRNYSEIMQNLAESEHIISVIPTIEGGHVFNENNAAPPAEDMLLKNIDTMLAWPFKPFFLAPAHHFYNHLCGHAYSLTNTVSSMLNQSEGVDTDITHLGNKAIRRLLDNQVLIDIKHMSRKSRRSFYSLLEEPAYAGTPIIVSHGNVNGYPTVDSDAPCNPDKGLFYGMDINFFDDEILRVGRSKGLFGIQLDERRIASPKEIKKIRKLAAEEVLCEKYSAFLWNQMLYIASLLDGAGENAWDCMCIGSDYDGIVDPLDGFWTSAEFPLLYAHVLQHAQKFVETTPHSFNKESNNITAEEMVGKLFSGNVMSFLAANYI